jgi:hypothetical protein
MVMMMMIMPPALNKYPLTPAHSRSLPLTPAHSRSLPLTPAHSRSLPLTLTPAPTLARAAFTRDHGFLVASALRSNHMPLQTSIPGNRRSTQLDPPNAPHSGDGAAVPGHPIPTGSRLHRPAPASEAVQTIRLAPVGPTPGPPHHSPTPRPPRGEGSLR